jgi:deoxyadenosine/deoxycytidine kinase
MRRPPTIVNQKPAVYYDLPLHFHYEAVERQTKPLQINPLWRQIVKILSKMSMNFPLAVYGFDRDTPDLMRRITQRLSERLETHRGDRPATCSASLA